MAPFKFPKIALLALALTIGACNSKSDEKLELPKSPVETGFAVGRDSFAFANFGGANPEAKIAAADLVRMFGADEVCAQTTPDGGCRLTKVAKAWLERINESMKGGRCEGFAVLSSLLHLGVVDPSTFGSSVVSEIPFEAPVKREIAYWFSTQYMPAAVKNTKAMDAVGAASFLAAEYEKPKGERDLWRVGITRIDGRGAPAGGHALTAYAVEPDATRAGRYLIKVYDNNHPADADRAIVVDANANT